ncbi:hypothetical protein K469DRAFT_697642 [Zopfia rhizophila CBS 207.26]|uniref:Uncharacterized protein n=1 Tax=Zopfia rhizophila CBS 207.26 TaxID=1314779 RepID=A0A6A6EF51_9PEZI|nr:hypothetical protein K469DRAFT_697642 [Zopfia rhizophila CBS 207.26]
MGQTLGRKKSGDRSQPGVLWSWSILLALWILTEVHPQPTSIWMSNHSDKAAEHTALKEVPPRKRSDNVLQLDRGTPSPQNPPFRKRSSLPTGSRSPLGDRPLLKRPRRSPRVAARKASEPKEISVRLDHHEERTRRYALLLPRYCNKGWEVEDLGDVYLEQDGSLTGKLLWEPTIALVSSLNGALFERAEELFKEKYGADEWDKWLKM